jgi:tetratricopeptide (TPR) repeat protein
VPFGRFKSAFNSFQTSNEPYGNLGSIYTQQGRTKEAKELLRKALTINPSYVNGWIHMAEANLREGDVKAARHAAQMALQLDPDNAPAKFLLQRITAQQEAVPTSNGLDLATRDAATVPLPSM